MSLRSVFRRQHRREAVEQREDRLRLSQEAGFGTVSWFSVAAGVLAAYGAFAVAAGIAAAVLNAVGLETEKISDNDWKTLGAGAGLVVAAIFLAAYCFGGYVAGRMARRAGLFHGLLVCLFGVLVLVVVAAIAHAEDGTSALLDRLDSLGIPTTGDEWAGVGSVAGIGALVALLVGGLLGGAAGERWHQRLAARALDPGYGPQADLERNQRKLEKAEHRLTRRREKAEQRGVLTPTRTGAGANAAGVGPAGDDREDEDDRQGEREDEDDRKGEDDGAGDEHRSFFDRFRRHSRGDDHRSGVAAPQ